MTDQPEALRVAEDLEQSRSASYTRDRNAARLLREQHAEIERLRNYLSIIKFQAELAREYIIELNDDCDAAVKRGKP